jgi:hypothetical protein
MGEEKTPQSFYDKGFKPKHRYIEYEENSGTN